MRRSTLTATLVLSLLTLALTGGITTGDQDAAFAASPSVGPGLGILRIGNSYQSGSGYDRYGYVIVGPGDAAAAGALPGMSLVYQSGTNVATGWSSGVPQPTALANGWLLKDAGGAYLTNAGFPGMYVGDVGSSGYQQAWVTNVSALLSRNGNDGVFIDDVIGEIVGLTGGKYPAKYPDQASWENAMASFIEYVGPALKSRGFYVLANANKYVSGDSGTDNGALVAQWWRRLGPSVSGLMSENWAQHPLDNTKLRGTGPDWWNNWDGWANLVSVAQSMGRDFVGLQYASSTNTRVMTYGKASFLLLWNGDGGAYMFNPDGSGDPWNPAWTTDIGTPSAARYQVGSGWRRAYSGGTVLLNPSTTSSQEFSLGATFATLDGTKVTTVTLPPTTAMILRNAEQPVASSPELRAPVNTSLMTISGSAAPGQNVTVSTGTWSNDPASYAYQWFRCDTSGGACIALPVTANAYTVSTNDVGHTLRASVVATNAAGSGTATSAPTATVAAVATAPAPTDVAPAISGSLPVISGAAKVGEKLSASTGDWSGSPTSFQYQWHRCDTSGGTCRAISAAVGSSYVVATADKGSTLRISVIATGPGGSASAQSASVGPIPRTKNGR